LDLQLFVELWFTESDFRPIINQQLAAAAGNVSMQQFTDLQNVLNAMNSGNNNNNNGGAAAGSNSINNSNSINGVNNSNNNMQQLCSRIFKVHFDPRQGIHIQLPVLFDYFHLSAVIVTVHCALLTLLPPVMLG
jgi:hypothetical protein